MQLGLRATVIHSTIEWCHEAGESPFIWVGVTKECEVPLELVNEQGIIVFDISEEAVDKFELSNEAIEFWARFSDDPKGISRVYIPLDCIMHVAPISCHLEGPFFQRNTDAMVHHSETQTTSESEDTIQRPKRIK